jgi:HPt (histidine-containing phosphotransfer) domain-containing protein
LPEDKSELKQAQHAGDFQQAGQLAHRIIGAASYCGANELVQAATRLQLAARNQDQTLMRDAQHDISAAMSHLPEWTDREIRLDSAGNRPAKLLTRCILPDSVHIRSSLRINTNAHFNRGICPVLCGRVI